MTKKELVKIIREVVKVEVKKQVNEILINEGKSSLKKQIKPVKKLSKPKPSKRKIKRKLLKGVKRSRKKY